MSNALDTNQDLIQTARELWTKLYEQTKREYYQKKLALLEKIENREGAIKDCIVELSSF